MRRRRPTVMLGVLLAGSVIVTTLTGPEIGALTYFLPVAYVLYLVAATYEHRRAAARVLIAVFATLLADAVLLHLTGGDADPNSGLVSAALCVIIAWFTGYTVRQRRRYALRLQDEAASKAVARGAPAHRQGTARRRGAQHERHRGPGGLRSVRHRHPARRRAQRPRCHPGHQPGSAGRDAPDARRPAPGGRDRPARGRAGRAEPGTEGRPMPALADAAGDAPGDARAARRARRRLGAARRCRPPPGWPNWTG